MARVPMVFVIGLIARSDTTELKQTKLRLMKGIDQAHVRVPF